MVAHNLRYIVFLGIIVASLIMLATAVSYVDFILANILWLAILIVFIYIIYRYDFLLQLLDYERAVIYRFGKVHRVGGPGWTFLWPVIESSKLVDLRIKTIDVDKQEVVTKDSIELSVDAIIYLKVKKDSQSVVNSVIEVEDYVRASQLYVVSALRDVIGSMELSEVISNIEVLNMRIKENLEKISLGWGIAVDGVEIKDVQIPEIVLNAMHEEKAAVQQKLARMERALAHKAEIQAVREAAAELDDKALAYYYIKAIENMSKGKGSQVFFPAEFSKLAGAFSNAIPDTSPKEKNVLTGANQKYKTVLKKYIDTAVKKAKKKSPTKKISVKPKKKKAKKKSSKKVKKKSSKKSKKKKK
jgi:regulator of protease activity HflC (stomatin/prohibitin superfamily)